MSVEMKEVVDSRPGSIGENGSSEIHYLLVGTSNDAEVRECLEANVPQYYQGMVRKSISYEPVSDPEVTNMWNVTATFAKAVAHIPETGESSFSFDTGGGTQHITQSIKTTDMTGDGIHGLVDYKQAIGVADDSIEGTDITVPVFNFSETHYFDDANVTDAYKQLLFRKTGMYNNDSFKGFSPGEVLFLGASGSRRGKGDWEITFRFAASQNRDDIMIGDIGPLTKKGWDYLWVKYEKQEDTEAKKLALLPSAVYIEQVYHGTDFTSLGIGN